VKRLLARGIERALGNGEAMRQHFTPAYNPWEQRLCLAPNGDLFKAIRQGRVAIVTDHIETFTETGIRLRSGNELAADLVVTATGLELQLFGGMQVSVDGRNVDFSQALTYKGMMYDHVPNFASVFGYTNASWTLKCDLTCAYICRLLNYMDARGYRQCAPRRPAGSIAQAPWIDFSSGYVQRSLAFLPKQGTTAPWKLHQNYVLDLLALKFGSVADEVMQFSNRQPRHENAS
jgi:monooxygenase